LLCSSLLAAPPTTAITGRVMSGGAPAGGVTVTASSDALQGERSTVTLADGRYWLTAMPPGKYNVTFSRKGLQTLTKRALVEIARVARADATLEPSEDEESITSTAITPTVADMTAITTHYSDLTLDRLPVRRSPYDFGFITSGIWRGGYAVMDDVSSFQTFVDPFDTMEQLTFVRAGMPVDQADPAPLAFARTRSGGEQFFLSLRDTITNGGWVSDAPVTFRDGVQHLTELAAGGRILPERLWFFASAWNGSEYWSGDRTGVLAKLSYQLGAQHNLAALYNYAKSETNDGGSIRSDEATFRYTGIAGPRFTTEVVAEHQGLEGFEDADGVFARSTYVIGTPAGDHVLSAGGQFFESGGYELNSLFLSDRWIVRRLTVNAGARHEHGETSPRAGAVFDILGNGRHAIVANYGDYRRGDFSASARELTLGYAIVIGNTGSARIDLVRRTLDRGMTNGVQADFNYSLFDRFQTGANYTYLQDADPWYYARNNGNAWFTLEIPFDEDELAVTVLERYLDYNGGHLLTDLGVRYTRPMGSTVVTGALDLTNAFDRKYSIRGREVRAWLRIRL
jgi:hypothetical protein